jgi:hypothetical protein
MKGLTRHRNRIVILILCLVTGCGFTAMSQDSVKSSVQVIQDDRVDLLVSKHVQINQNRNGIDGYRIQIFFDSGNNSKTKAQSIYEEFMQKYPSVGAYLSFKAPNYKVRVGDFRTKLDAQRFLNEIIAEYPNAWIINDLINLPKVE